MYSVLLVDDEKYARLWIKNCIRWEEYGYHVIDEAGDGQSALKKIEALKPDLVVTDMSMPDIDGAMLIEQANSLNACPFFIVLSGYDEFEYMRSAVKWNAVDYLLKPVKEEELLQALKRVKEKIAKREREQQEIQNARTVSAEHRELITEKLVAQLLNDSIADKEALFQKVQHVGIRLEGRLFCGFSVAVEPPAEKAPTPADYISIGKYTFSQVGGSLYFLATDHGFDGFASFPQESTIASLQDVVKVFQRFIQNVYRSTGFHISIGVGNTVSQLDLLGASLIQAQKALDLRIIYGSGNTFTLLNVPESTAVQMPGFISENGLINMLLSHNAGVCADLIRNAFTAVRESAEMTVAMVKMLYYQCITIIFKALYESGISPLILDESEYKIFAAIKNYSSMDEIENKLIAYSEKAVAYISNKQNIKNTAVERAKEYIEDHLSEEISLTDIANCVHVTANYLCTLFKAETGETIFECITQLRIKKVMLLMRDERLGTYEIGRTVGYSDPKYFSRVFKRIAGMSPSVYRKTLFKIR